MKLKAALLAAVIAAGAASGAGAADTVTNGSFTEVNKWTFSSPVNRIASELTDVGVVDTGGLFDNVAGLLTQSIQLTVGKYFLTFDGLFRGNSGSWLTATITSSKGGTPLLESLNGSEIAGSQKFGFEVTKAGKYTLLFGGLSLGRLGSYIAVDNVAITKAPNNNIPVPGPEAGAGLAGLAMVGMYAWASRRRKAQVSA